MEITRDEFRKIAVEVALKENEAVTEDGDDPALVFVFGVYALKIIKGIEEKLFEESEPQLN